MIVKNVAFFLISNIMVLALPHQLQILWQLHLMELLGLLTGMRATHSCLVDQIQIQKPILVVDTNEFLGHT